MVFLVSAAAGAGTASATTTTRTIGLPIEPTLSTLCPAGPPMTGMRVYEDMRMYVTGVSAICGNGSVAAPFGNVATRSVEPACEKTVAFALVDARTTGCLNRTGPMHWETTDLVNLNGVPVPVAPGTKLTLTGPTAQAPGGQISVMTAIAIPGVVTLQRQLISTKLPAGGPGEEKDLISLQPDAHQKYLGFEVGGKVALRIAKDVHGTGFSRLVLVLGLPSVFKSGPTANAGGLTATLAVRAGFDGIQTDAAKLEIANAYIGQTELKNLCLSYTGPGSSTSPCVGPPFGAAPLLKCESGTDQARWDGSALIALPTAGRPELGLFAGVKGGRFSYASAQVTNLANNVPIATGVFLDKFGLGLCLNPAPLMITGAAGVRFGPLVAGVGAAFVDGSITYVDSRPWTVTATGSLALFDKTVASGFLKVQSSGAIDFGFGANLDFVNGLLTVNGAVRGWYQPVGRAFDVFGSARVCVVRIVCTGGEAAVSSVGVAGCADLLTLGYPEPYWFGVRWVSVKIRAGGGYRWSTKKVDVMGQSCGTGSYRAHKSAAVAAGGERTIAIQSSPATVLRLEGASAPPKVQLVSPRGATITLDATGAFQAGRFLYAEDTEDNSTEITIARPAPGTWRIRVLPASSPLVSVSDATVEPPASAAGTVTGTGRDRVLHYIYEHQPNQHIQFVEQGTDYERGIGMAVGGRCMVGIPSTPAGDLPARPALSCGSIRFAAAPGPAGPRRIIGVVTNGDEPVTEVQVATYVAPAEAKLAAPATVTIARTGTTVSVGWLPVSGARSYDVSVALNDGEHVVRIAPANRHTATLPEPVAPSDRIVATVSAVSSEEIAGSERTAVSPGQAGALALGPEPPPLH